MERAELKLTHITRYEDVERGQLVLTVGDKKKSWKATWQTDLRTNFNGSRHLPRGTLPLYLNRARAPWGTCPRLKPSLRTTMWMEPLNTVNWSDFGVNLYLCDPDDYFQPLCRAEFMLMVLALEHYNIRELIVDEPQVVKPTNQYKHGFEFEFWKNDN